MLDFDHTVRGKQGHNSKEQGMSEDLGSRPRALPFTGVLELGELSQLHFPCGTHLWYGFQWCWHQNLERKREKILMASTSSWLQNALTKFAQVKFSESYCLCGLWGGELHYTSSLFQQVIPKDRSKPTEVSNAVDN